MVLEFGELKKLVQRSFTGATRRKYRDLPSLVKLNVLGKRSNPFRLGQEKITGSIRSQEKTWHMVVTPPLGIRCWPCRPDIILEAVWRIIFLEGEPPVIQLARLSWSLVLSICMEKVKQKKIRCISIDLKHLSRIQDPSFPPLKAMIWEFGRR